MAFLGDDGVLQDVTDEALANVGKGGGGPIEAGWYRMVLLEDEVQAKPWGVGLNMQFQIIEGDYQNRRVFDYLCVRHSNSEKAEEIARAKLKALAVAAGAKNPNDVRDTGPLYNKPVMGEIRRENDDTKYAEEDGKKGRLVNFLSKADYEAEIAGKPRSIAPTNSPGATPSPPDDPFGDEMNPFD